MKAKLAEAEGRLLCSKCQGDMLPNKDGVYEFETFRPGYSGTVHSYLYSLVVTVFVIFIYWFLLHFTRWLGATSFFSFLLSFTSCYFYTLLYFHSLLLLVEIRYFYSLVTIGYFYHLFVTSIYLFLSNFVHCYFYHCYFYVCYFQSEMVTFIHCLLVRFNICYFSSFIVIFI